MRLKPYYCPHCKQYKSWWQVTNVDAYDYDNCKHCGTHIIRTETIARFLLEKQATKQATRLEKEE